MAKVLSSLLLSCVVVSHARLSQRKKHYSHFRKDMEKKIVKNDGGMNTDGQWNVVFAICESTAASAYFPTEEAPMPIPNIRWAQQNGVTFLNHYVVAPVCCPSRATIMSSRHAHQVPHYQKNPNTGLFVSGAWNNHEGLDPHFNASFLDALKQNGGVAWEVFGKKDWDTGNHSVDAFITSLGNKVNFPYSVSNGSMGWYDESGPLVYIKDSNDSNATQWPSDWDDLSDLQSWVTEMGQSGQQWFAQFSPSICHPSYKTTEYWMNQVDQSQITVPQWQELDEMHPEDFCQSMKKKMVAGNPPCCDDSYKIEVRQAYYANVAEYDSMIGEIFNTLENTGQLNNTWIILTSDHGDMQMEHQQYYKMVPFESSTHVPLIVVPPLSMSDIHTRGTFIKNYTQSIDLYPSILEMAGVPAFDDYQPSGDDFVKPFIYDEYDSDTNQRKPFALSQFHGDEVHLSWYEIIHDGFKYIAYGSGHEVNPRLFNLTDDPGELKDYGNDPNYADMVLEYDKMLREQIDYPSVSTEVEIYNKDSFVLWRDTFDSKQDYIDQVSNLRWRDSWAYAPDECLLAIEAWLQTPNDTYSWSTCPWQGRPKIEPPPKKN